MAYQPIAQATPKLNVGTVAPRPSTALPGLAPKPVALTPAQIQQQNQVKFINALPPDQQAQFAAMVRGLQGQHAAAVNPLMLPASQTIQFANQRQLANEQYRQMIAENAFQRAQTGQGFGRASRDLGLQYAFARENEPDQFVQRGILGSGIQHQDLQRLTDARLRSVGDLQQQRAGALSAISMARTQIERSRDLQLAQIEQQRQQALAAYAARSIK